MGDGPMGGGPMGDAGPCPRCNRLNQNDLARNRDGVGPAPFPNANGANSSILDEVDTVPDGSIPVEEENILEGTTPSQNEPIAPSVGQGEILGGGVNQGARNPATLTPTEGDNLKPHMSQQQFLDTPSGSPPAHN